MKKFFQQAADFKDNVNDMLWGTDSQSYLISRFRTHTNPYAYRIREVDPQTLETTPSYAALSPENNPQNMRIERCDESTLPVPNSDAHYTKIFGHSLSGEKAYEMLIPNTSQNFDFIQTCRIASKKISKTFESCVSLDFEEDKLTAKSMAKPVNSYTISPESPHQSSAARS